MNLKIGLAEVSPLWKTAWTGNVSERMDLHSLSCVITDLS